ncbi:aminotransferase class I/II-fold pyridoxal phosphate-dependent enzyme [Amycolatopsis pithecellobii]|uniref:8-amino-7-oxononanoate synthase n=1 Tax=Amycolatopsis pithecellobii TaxID=664692 RepID=A0A6N7ZAX5_9PSEU|nr:aminotransferase class I/II-fold pyridoxal phosphate-dependent enzyme [Amycolatopsis pithecellobii]MTD58916.1 aminotransferase class I/II-fold pyridoxal phosphate-dependent enzyme [Amycolatopsis pithecellobii]
MIPSVISDHIARAPTGPPLVVESAGRGRVRLDSAELINMASCDYLGFARDPRVTGAAIAAIGEWGLGMAATRVLSGSTAPHRTLEHRLARWVGTGDSVLYGSCWTANAAVFEVLATLARQAGRTLAVFSDRLNHASIIDGISAQRKAVSELTRYDHDDHAVLVDALGRAPADALKIVVTDGVFSMEGDQAPLSRLVELTSAHDALLVVDDSHGIGVLGETGRGTAEAQGALGQIDIITGTLGKALGGASGGFVATTPDLVTTMRATARPFIFSNNPPTPVVAGALAALDILADDPRPLADLRARIGGLREGITRLGLPTVPGEHPIVPVLIGDDVAAHDAARHLRRHQVFATALSHPVVPRGEARLRLQVSVNHSPQDIAEVVEALAGWRRPAGAGR